MAELFEALDRFVRLNRTGEIVEVVSLDWMNITISSKGKNLTMGHHEFSRITPEETAAAEERLLG